MGVISREPQTETWPLTQLGDERGGAAEGQQVWLQGSPPCAERPAAVASAPSQAVWGGPGPPAAGRPLPLEAGSSQEMQMTLLKPRHVSPQTTLECQRNAEPLLLIQKHCGEDIWAVKDVPPPFF